MTWKYVGTYDKDTPEEEIVEMLKRAVRENAQEFYGEKRNMNYNESVSYAIAHNEGTTELGEPILEHAISMQRVISSMGAPDEDIYVAAMLYGQPLGKVNPPCSEEVMYLHNLLECENIADLAEENDLRYKAFILAHVVADQRYLLSRLENEGEDMWSTLPEDKEYYRRYYTELQNTLFCMMMYEPSHHAFGEMVDTYESLFVICYIDYNNDILYQFSGEDGFKFTRNKLEWIPVKKTSPYAVPATKQEVDELVDEWRTASEEKKKRMLEEGRVRVPKKVAMIKQ